MSAENERETLQRLSRRYESEGYEVFLQKEAQALLPEELRSFVPDLVVKKGSELTIVEIKQRGSRNNALASIADRIREYPNLQLDVVIVGGPINSAIETLPKDIVESLDAASELFESKNAQSAFLLLWSAFEAAAMAALSAIEPRVGRPQSPEALVKSLVFEGLLDDDQHERLMEISKVRNLVAHGGLTVPIEKDDFRYLEKVVRKLIEPFEPDSRAA